MVEVNLYDVYHLNTALLDSQTKKINVFFVIKDEDLISICRLFSFRKFIIYKNQSHLTVFFPNIKPSFKGSDFVI